MSAFGGWAVPGTGAIVESTEREIFWGGDMGKGMVLQQNANYSGTARDAGHTNYTTVLRAGLLMGKLRSGGELTEWDWDGGTTAATKGEETIFGVVPYEVRTQDFNATNTDRVAGIVVRAPLKASQLLIEGSALVGHAAEFIARRQLHSLGCVLDDDPGGHLAGATWREQIQTGDVTLVEADNATRFRCHSADCEFTLPTIKDGLKFAFFMGEDFELKITSAETGNMLFGNDQVADDIAWTTASEQIGAHILCEAMTIDIAGTLTPTWTIDIRKTAFSTDDFLAHTITT